MNETQIADALESVLDSRGLFLVGIKISRDDDITVEVEAKEGNVTLDDCEAVNRVFTSTFSQDDEDYSLTVSSAGLDSAFKVAGQFEKAVGSRVEVWMKGGKKVFGTLQAYSPEAISVDGTSYPMNEVNKVKYIIEF